MGPRIESHARSRVKLESSPAAAGPAPLLAVLAVSFLGSVSGGVFWSGVFFVTLRHYAFSERQNLALALGMGGLYSLVAFLAGRVYERAPLAPRSLLGLALLVWGLAAGLPVLLPAMEWALWVGAFVGSASSGLVWPAVEGYLGARRHGADLRRSIGIFNVTWTIATALPLLVLPLLTRLHALAPLGLCTLMSALSVASLVFLPSAPPSGEAEVARAAVGQEYPELLRAAAALLPLSYLMSATLSPVLPHRLAELGPGIVPASVVAATWMVARVFTLAAMASLPFWHGRWGALLAAGATLAGGLGAVLLATSLGGLVVGLFLFGVGMGLTYYATLYYSLAVGHGEVDAGGGFEALVGLGYVLGPLVGLAGHAFATGATARTATVALTWLSAALGGGLALRAYLRARERR